MSTAFKSAEEVLEEAYGRWLLNEGGCAEYKLLGDGVYAAIKPLLFHWTMIVGEVGNHHGYFDRWCYENRDLAQTGLRAWNGTGDPVGWHRHIATGRRRPGGDPAKEYIDG